MRSILLLLLLISGCATQVSVSLPLRKNEIIVPHSISAAAKTSYVDGFRDGWNETLRIYATDIDHELNLLDYAGKGEYPPHRKGWVDAHVEAEA